MPTQFPSIINLSSLNGTNGFVLNGEATGDQSGASVTAAGDVNGDGLNDVIVGAEGHSSLGLSMNGRSYVVFGSRSIGSGILNLTSLNGTNGFVLNGERTIDYSGSPVSAAGDVNGDGLGDVIVGAWDHDSLGLFHSGRSYVVFGSRSIGSGILNLNSLNGTNGFVLNGEAAGDWSGHSVSAAGDVNGDGVGDVIVGAYGHNSLGLSTSGRSYVVFGSRTIGNGIVNLGSLNGTNGFVLNGETAGDCSGLLVSAAGDVNGDGVGDVIVGVQNHASLGLSASGRSYVVFGSRSIGNGVLNLTSLNGTNGFVLNGEAANDRSGASVSAAGDVNGDGIGDVIVGAYQHASLGLSYSGRSYVVFGSRSIGNGVVNLDSLNGANGFVLNGEATFDRSGYSVSTAGDVNGDGLDDVIVGAHTHASLGLTNSGRSYVVFGSRIIGNGILNLASLNGANGFILNGEATGDQSGASVSAAGDVNGDGVDDIIVGAYYHVSLGLVNSGRSYVVFGVPGPVTLSPSRLPTRQPSALPTLQPSKAPSQKPSLLPTLEPTRGPSKVPSTVPSSVPTVPTKQPSKEPSQKPSLWPTLEPTQIPTLAKSNLPSLYPSTVPSTAPSAEPTQEPSVLPSRLPSTQPSGKPSGIPSATPTQLPSQEPSQEPSRLPTREPSLLPTAFPTLEPSLAPTIPTQSPSIAPSLVPTVPTYQPSFSPTQPIQFPAAINLAALNGINGFVLNGEVAGDRSGLSVSAAGDVNGDGVGDVIVGAYTHASFGLTDSGRSYVVFGSRSIINNGIFNLSSLNGTNGFVLNGEAAGDQSGASVSAAGDVNGDGLNDVIVGANYHSSLGLTYSGRSYVVFGSRTIGHGLLNLSSLNGTNGFVLNGEVVTDHSGWSVSAAGDVNGDGLGDVIVGAHGHASLGLFSSGRSYVVFGSRTIGHGVLNLTSLNGTNGFVLNGEVMNDVSGISVSAAGDVNGDGLGDVIVGASYHDSLGLSNSGRSYVVFGSRTIGNGVLNLGSLNGTNGFALNGEAASDYSGMSVSAAGDVNGDGIGDVIVGAYQHASLGLSNSGRSYVVFGSRAIGNRALNLTSLNGTNGFVLNGEAVSDYSGRSVSAAGDVNGDGIGDIIVGAYQHASLGLSYSGRSYVVFGSRTIGNSIVNLSSLNGTNGFVLNGEAASDWSGWSVSAAGDVNGDGVGDVIVGAYGHDSLGLSASGRSYVVFGVPPITSSPTGSPTVKPSQLPSKEPSKKPSRLPTREPSLLPTALPTLKPSLQPSKAPSQEPSALPSRLPSTQPTTSPSFTPSNEPSQLPTGLPTNEPTVQPTRIPTLANSNLPSLYPSTFPSTVPSVEPTQEPSALPSRLPSTRPSGKPFLTPSATPSNAPSEFPTLLPTGRPSRIPTLKPSAQPSLTLTGQPTPSPTTSPSLAPQTNVPTTLTPQTSVPQTSVPQTSVPQTNLPTTTAPQTVAPATETPSSALPSTEPTQKPSALPSGLPSNQPSGKSSVTPSRAPSSAPSEFPTLLPAATPSRIPTLKPSVWPSLAPTGESASKPTIAPSLTPQTNLPTTSAPLTDMPSSAVPTLSPTLQPTQIPTLAKSNLPSKTPSTFPSLVPSAEPTQGPSALPSALPSNQPSGKSSVSPSSTPSEFPTLLPTAMPSRIPTLKPNVRPSLVPTGEPTSKPTTASSLAPQTNLPTTSVPVTEIPSSATPTLSPTLQPTQIPTLANTNLPSKTPSTFPSLVPSAEPTQGPSALPSGLPSKQPSGTLLSAPSLEPSQLPSELPTSEPTLLPTTLPTGIKSNLPSLYPSTVPSTVPSAEPTEELSALPSRLPSTRPSGKPFLTPSATPSNAPSEFPTLLPTGRPSRIPTLKPSVQPSLDPTRQPIPNPTASPSLAPETTLPSTSAPIVTISPNAAPQTAGPVTEKPSSALPSTEPTQQPSVLPSRLPSNQPSQKPSVSSSQAPSSAPSEFPTLLPTATPSRIPTLKPSVQPSTGKPTPKPTTVASFSPQTNLPTTSAPLTEIPSAALTSSPTLQPTQIPTVAKSNLPSKTPSTFPSLVPSAEPTQGPSALPSRLPSKQPSSAPSSVSSLEPSQLPTGEPTIAPTEWPSRIPTLSRSNIPTQQPSKKPSVSPTSISTTPLPTKMPTTVIPSVLPTAVPVTAVPRLPTTWPLVSPTDSPITTTVLTETPSDSPTTEPAALPTATPITIILSTLPTASPVTEWPTPILTTIEPSIFSTDSPLSLTLSPTTLSATFLPTVEPTDEGMGAAAAAIIHDSNSGLSAGAIAFMVITLGISVGGFLWAAWTACCENRSFRDKNKKNNQIIPDATVLAASESSEEKQSTSIDIRKDAKTNASAPTISTKPEEIDDVILEHVIRIPRRAESFVSPAIIVKAEGTALDAVTQLTSTTKRDTGSSLSTYGLFVNPIKKDQLEPLGRPTQLDKLKL